MTLKERKELLKTFKLLREHRNSNYDLQTYGLCVVASRLHIHGLLSRSAAQAAINHINDLMGLQCYVSYWLETVANVPPHQLTPHNLRQYRTRWLDHIIEELEK